MEPIKGEMMVIAFIDAWYVIDINDSNRILSGPIQDHADALEYVRSRAFRIAKGWAP